MLKKQDGNIGGEYAAICCTIKPKYPHQNYISSTKIIAQALLCVKEIEQINLSK